MKREQVLEQLLAKAKSDRNTLGFLVYGSVASGTHHEESDIDTFTILRNQKSSHDMGNAMVFSKPSNGIEITIIGGVEVDNMFLTHEILTRSVVTVPYLLYILGKATLLFDRENTIKPLLKKIINYFDENPEIENEWDMFYKQHKEERLQFGYVKTSIIDVWNELEKRHSGGKIKRPFANSFYFTNPLIFSLVKRFLEKNKLR